MHITSINRLSCTLYNVQCTFMRVHCTRINNLEHLIFLIVKIKDFIFKYYITLVAAQETI